MPCLTLCRGSWGFKVEGCNEAATKQWLRTLAAYHRDLDKSCLSIDWHAMSQGDHGELPRMEFRCHIIIRDMMM